MMGRSRRASFILNQNSERFLRYGIRVVPYDHIFPGSPITSGQSDPYDDDAKKIVVKPPLLHNNFWGRVGDNSEAPFRLFYLLIFKGEFCVWVFS